MYALYSREVEFNSPTLDRLIGHFEDETFQAISCTGTDNRRKEKTRKNQV